MNSVAEHGRREASLARAVGNPNGRGGRVETGGPSVDAGVDGVDGCLVEGEGNDLVDLQNNNDEQCPV